MEITVVYFSTMDRYASKNIIHKMSQLSSSAYFGGTKAL